MRIPEKLSDYRMYLNDSPDIKAVTDVTLPSLRFLTDTVSGAGVLGEYEAPNLMHLESAKATINWKSLTTEALPLLIPKAVKIELQAANQEYNVKAGAHEYTVTRALIKGIPLGTEPGSMSKGANYDGSTEVEVLYMKLEYQGTVLVEFDKVNYIYRVNGVDYTAPLRAALGI